MLNHPAVFHFNNACLAARLCGVENIISVLYSAAAYPRPTEHRRHLGLIPGFGLWWHILRIRARLVLRLSHKVLFASPWHARRFHAAYELPARNAYVVPHLGADTRRFCPDPECRARQRGRWGVTKDQLILGYVGRLDHHKGPDLLVEALGHLPPAIQPRIRVVIAGSGPMYEELRMRTGQLGWEENVHFLGFTRTPEQVFQAADIVAVPSRLECFGLSLVEAMACGTAVVAANIGGLAANLSHPDAQGAGLPIQPEDSSALAAAIAALADQPERRRQMGQRARRFVCNHFSSQAVLQLIQDILESKTTQRVRQARWTRAKNRPKRRNLLSLEARE
jgi:glycosyltransferase involved in cell wall biosynthesis